VSARESLRRGRGGFTLLEVMIALAILAMVGIAFLRAQATSVRLISESNQITQATLLAREKIAEMETIGFAEAGKQSGGGGDFFPGYRWEQVILPTEIPSLQKALVRVLWKEGTQERSFELTAYFAKR
jgi:general secretion pathway protein I